MLVFEDLHWADEAMLAFLEHLADLAEGVPLLVVGTARPELYERHPDYAARLRNVNTINLAPLSQEETARLVSALLEATVLPAELQQPILDRAGGNPLYAEEFVRLLKDRDLLVRKGSSWELREGAEVPFPDSVQALIAARLDTLEPEAKSLLADAAVIGKVFWAGAIAAMGDRDLADGDRHAAGVVAQGAGAAGAAARRWRGRPSTRSGTSWPAMSPTASFPAPPAPPATSLPPPGSSRRRPSGSRTWPTCSPTTTRPRWSSPGQPGRPSRRPSWRRPRCGSSGWPESAPSASTPRRPSRASSERWRSPRRGIRERAAALARFGEAALEAGRFAEAAEALEEAIAAFQARGDVRRGRRCDGHASARCSTSSAIPAGGRCPPRRWRCWSRCRRARSWSRRSPPLASVETLQGTKRGRDRYADGRSRWPSSSASSRPARALGFRGLARCRPRRPGRAATTSGRRSRLRPRPGRDARSAVLHNNLGGGAVGVRRAGGRSRGAAGGHRVRAGRGARRDGRLMTAQQARSALRQRPARRGARARRRARRAISEATDVVLDLGSSRRADPILRCAGRPPRWPTRSTGSKPPSARRKPRIDIVFGLGAAALARAALGQHDRAAALLAEIEANPGARETPELRRAACPRWCAPPSRTATTRSRNDSWPASNPATPYAEHALADRNAALAEAARRPRRPPRTATRRPPSAGETFGVVPEQAFALLGQGRCLVALGHMTEAAQPSAWPATSSRSYKPPRRSPRPTRFSNRRPRSAHNTRSQPKPRAQRR